MHRSKHIKQSLKNITSQRAAGFWSDSSTSTFNGGGVNGLGSDNFTTPCLFLVLRSSSTLSSSAAALVSRFSTGGEKLSRKFVRSESKFFDSSASSAMDVNRFENKVVFVRLLACFDFWSLVLAMFFFFKF